MMRAVGRITLFVSFLCLLPVLFLIADPLPASASPLPWRISIYPETIYIAPPQCKASFVVNVEADYKDKPIELMFDELSEGTWSGPGTLISSAYFGGKDGERPVGTDYEKVITLGVVAPWEKPGTYRVRIYAFPKGNDPFAYPSYQILTIVVADTGIKKCDSGYWPPPPSGEETDFNTDQDDQRLDDTDDNNGFWYWWRQWWPHDGWGWFGSWWYRLWPWEDNVTKADFDFRLTAMPSFHSTEPGQTVNFEIGVKRLAGTSQPVALSLTGLPTGAASSFSISSAEPDFSSLLSIIIDSSLAPGTYPFTVTGNGGGKTHSTTLSLIIAENRETSIITLSIDPPSIKTGEAVSVTGTLSPPLVVPIELLYTRPDGFEMIKHVNTNIDGTFTDSANPDQSGAWLVRARWFGDNNYFGSESLPAGLTVETLAAPQASASPALYLLLLVMLLIIVVLFVLVIRKQR